MLQSAGWAKASDGARAAFEAACGQLSSAGVARTGREADPAIEAMEQSLGDMEARVPFALDWEMRWPLGGYRRLNPGKVSQTMLDRLAANEAGMDLDGYNDILAWRLGLRAQYARLAERSDGCVMLAATGQAPEGLDWTGDPNMNIPGSTLGVPACAIPGLSDRGLPLGLQFMGFAHQDRALMEMAEWGWRLFGAPFREAAL